VNMAKYRKLQQEMEGAVERADMAENTLGQLRARNRSASVAPESTTTFGLTVNKPTYLLLLSAVGKLVLKTIFLDIKTLKS